MGYESPQMYRYKDPTLPPTAPALSVYFEETPVVNADATREKGIQTYDNVLIAYVSPMGMPKSNAACEIRRTLPNGTVIRNMQHSAKYAEQVKAYDEGIKAETQGTPLKDLVGMTRGMEHNLRARAIHCIEDLADCQDTVAHDIMGFWDLREKAKSHLKARADAAPTVRLLSELAERDKKLAAQQRQIDELVAAIAAAGGDPSKIGAKGKPGRKPRAVATEEQEAA